MRKSILAIVIAGIAILGISSIKADAVNVTLRQQLLPIDCVFVSIDDGLGTINYLTPAECGQILPPEPTTTEPPIIPSNPVASPVNIPTVPISVRTSSNGQSTAPVYDLPGASRIALLLNSINEATHGEGYRVRVKAGDSLFYRPLDDPEAAVRSITFAGIDEDSVWWEVRPLGLNFNTALGEKEFFDQLKTHEPAASLRVMEVHPDGTADVLVRLYEPTMITTVSPTVATRWLIITGLLILALMLRFHPHLVRRPKHPTHHHLTRA